MCVYVCVEGMVGGQRVGDKVRPGGAGVWAGGLAAVSQPANQQ